MGTLSLFAIEHSRHETSNFSKNTDLWRDICNNVLNYQDEFWYQAYVADLAVVIFDLAWT
jgi:hypothetical protein